MNVATMTIASHLATKAIKSEWRRQKINWVWVEHKELVSASMAYLEAHPELLEEAAETVRNDPNFRTLAERYERKRKGKRQ
jgi:hypothetical protein